MLLDKNLYKYAAPELAPILLGKLLCRNIDGTLIKKRITETEAYYTEADTACHASKGKTKRTQILYEEGGYAYVYLCYGIHNLFNVVCGDIDIPQAVLIRGVHGYNGPGKLTKIMHIDRSFYGHNLVASNQLWIEDDGYKAEYISTPRVGIDYATKEYKDILWRFIIKNV